MRPWIALLVLLAGCADVPSDDAPDAEPIELPDPLADGVLRVASSTWENSVTVVVGDDDAGVPQGVYPVELRGTIHVPEDPGPHPVAIFMHGRHSTCRYADATEFLAPGVCPDAQPVIEPVRSARGYEELAQFLASHGFVVLSVNANNVNDHDGTFSVAGDDSGATARAHIIGRVLRDLADANAGNQVGDLPDLSGRLRMDHVGLMGHSRGGEGVVAAAELMRTGVVDGGQAALRGVFALAPTDFQRWPIQEVPFATILPYCDGDVSNLQGAWMYDDNRGRAPVHQFIAMGANHNYYNTIWTNDDFGSREDSWCSLDAAASGRSTPSEQREQGTMLMATFLRAYVGGEADLMPYLTGAASWPIDTPTSFHPVDATDCLTDDHNRQACDVGGAAIQGPLSIATCFASACPGQNSYGQARQHVLTWDGDAAWSVPTRAEGNVSMRFAIAPGSEAAERVTLRIGDEAWTLAELGLHAAPGDNFAKTLQTMIRVPVPAGADVIQLQFNGSGTIQTTDWLVV